MGWRRFGERLRLLYGEQAKYFEDEVREELTHAKRGTLCMAPSGPNQNTSQVCAALELRRPFVTVHGWPVAVCDHVSGGR